MRYFLNALRVPLTFHIVATDAERHRAANTSDLQVQFAVSHDQALSWLACCTMVYLLISHGGLAYFPYRGLVPGE